MKKKRGLKRKSSKKKSRARSRRRYQSDALKKRMKKSRERAQGGQRSIIKGDIPLWRPKDGYHIIDIIPYLAGKNDPQTEKGDPTYTLETHVHTNIGPDNLTMLCPARMYGDKCPICEHRDKLRERGAKEDEWKPLFPKVRHLYNVVCYDKGEEKKGVQVWDVPWFYSEKHLQALAERPARGGKRREINFPDEEEGKSITFNIEPAKSKNDFPSYVGWAFEDRDYSIDDDLLDAAFTLDEIIKIPKYDEISEAYWGKDKKRRKADRDDDDEENEELTEALEELEDLEDMEELEDFIEEYDLDVKIKKKDDEEDVKEKIQNALDDKFGETDEEDEDEDDEEEEDEPEYTKKEIKKMKKKKLLRLIDDEDLDIDEDDWDDIDELKELVIEELDL